MNTEAHVWIYTYIYMPRVSGCCNNTSLKVRMFICCGFRKCWAHLDTPLNSISFSSLCSLLSRKFCSVHFTAGRDEKEEQTKMWPYTSYNYMCVCILFLSLPFQNLNYISVILWLL